MTALFIAGYALGAVLTWVAFVRHLARGYTSDAGWEGSDFVCSLLMAAIWPAALPVVLLLSVDLPDWPAPGTRLFNYFKRRG